MDPCSAFKLLSHRKVKSSSELIGDEIYLWEQFNFNGLVTIMTWSWNEFKILDMSNGIFGIIAINGDPYLYNSYDQLVFVDPKDYLHFGIYCDYYAALRIKIKGKSSGNKFLDNECTNYLQTDQGKQALLLMSSNY